MNELINADYERAYTLHRRIVINAQTAQESLFEVCKGLKEMRDTELFKELGYKNFKDYSQAELGMTSRNANRYISIAEMVGKSGTSMSPNIGTTRLYLLSTLAEEDRKEVAESIDLENTSVRELQKKIDDLKAEKEYIKHEAELDRKEQKRANELAQSFKEECRRRAEEQERLEGLVSKLQEDIKDLEARPVEVAVEKDPETEKKLAKKEEDLKKLKDKLKRAQDELSKEKESVQAALDKQAAEHKSETDKLAAEKAELERQLAVKPKEIRVTVDEDKVTFKIKLSTAYEALMPAAQFAASSGNDEFKAKLNALLDAARKVVEGNG